MHAIRVVFGKELIDGRRDRRAVMSAFIFPVMAPILVYGMMTFIINMRHQAQDTAIPMVGLDNAPSFVRWLEEKDVNVTEFKGDPRLAVENKEVELVAVIPNDFGERFAQTRTAVIEIVYDGSRTDAMATVGRFRGLIREYSSEIAALRLIVRGVTPEVMRVVIAEDIDVASKQQRAVAALNFIPLYIILAAFVAGMGIAVDSTAGERERKTLEPLLINPVERHDFVIGKWLAASIFAALGVVLTLILCIVALVQVPLDQIGLNFHITGTQILLMIIAVLPLALLATSMQMLLGIFARSFKDAQSYIGLLTMLPMIPSFFLMLNPVATQVWMYAVPMLGQHLLMVEVLGNKDVPIIAYAYSSLASVVMGLALALITARLFQRENII
ncbi:MAG: ABC transporter permease [Proteobacteria bacterium]|nr:ABC transporter permease [Pseudomonadota bacterium]MDA1298724.1 ABC transporter permease [Pseudomonadota bacterium]